MKKNILPFKSKTLSKAWLITLLDLMTLMLTFFIMIYAMSTPNENIINQSSNPRADAFSSLKRGVHLNYLEQILTQKIAAFDGYEVEQNNSYLYIQLPKDIFEDAKNRKISIHHWRRLQSLGETLNNVSNKIILEVGTDMPVQEALLQTSAIANALKSGGYLFNLPIRQYKNRFNKFVRIIILPQIRGKK